MREKREKIVTCPKCKATLKVRFSEEERRLKSVNCPECEASLAVQPPNPRPKPKRVKAELVPKLVAAELVDKEPTEAEPSEVEEPVHVETVEVQPAEEDEVVLVEPVIEDAEFTLQPLPEDLASANSPYNLGNNTSPNLKSQARLRPAKQKNKLPVRLIAIAGGAFAGLAAFGFAIYFGLSYISKQSDGSSDLAEGRVAGGEQQENLGRKFVPPESRRRQPGQRTESNTRIPDASDPFRTKFYQDDPYNNKQYESDFDFLGSRSDQPIEEQKEFEIIRHRPSGSYKYRIRITAETKPIKTVYAGSIELTALSGVRRALSETRSSDSSVRSGSGFVISSDGLIATSAQLVKDASVLQVEVSSLSYAAKVIEIDDASDIAILKIRSSQLKSLRLGDSNRVQLGQELQISGFPLPRTPNPNHQVVPGLVSGIINQEGQQLIQTDGKTNPGFAGGPVLNAEGRVVGIASSKTEDAGDSQVGFSLPSSALSSIVEKAGIKLQPSPSQPSYPRGNSAPSLLSQISPSMALVKVANSGAQIASTGFSYTGTMHETSKPGETLVFDSDKFSIDEQGLPVCVGRAGSYVPLLMDRFPILTVVPTPRFETDRWTRRRKIRLPISRMRTDLFPISSAEKSRFPGVQDAHETDTYDILSSTEDEVTLLRSHELQTTAGREPHIKLAHSGTWVVQRSTGMLSEVELNGSLEITLDDSTLAIPFHCKIELDKPPESVEN